MQAYAQELAALTAELAAIPSPSGHERKKAEFIRNWFVRECGVTPAIDEVDNVVLKINGPEPGLIAYLAHTDTVFGQVDKIEPVERDGRLYAPSIGDDSCNAAALMLVTRRYLQENKTGGKSRLIVFNVGEEGLGNLRGVRHIMACWPVTELVAIDGTLDELITAGVGSLRYRITVSTEGGHSWTRFGNKNAIYYAARLIKKLQEMSVPLSPKTTYNVGTVNGGTSVNTIAQHCEMLLDLRSEDAACLEAVRDQTFACIESERIDGVTIETECLGDRPVGPNQEQSALVQHILAIRAEMGLSATTVAASTDCNIPLSMGVPSACFGVYLGKGAHTMEEYLELDSLPTGLNLLWRIFTEL
ncbi:MAG: M20/M25/M40 family metallo-hydrolase [Clostridia bacterium]|nr:M20/M25/M40 family metallo-hydrolase [Clostridia bacterium]